MIHVIPDSSVCAKCHAKVTDAEWRAHLLACQGIDLPEHPRVFYNGVEITIPRAYATLPAISNTTSTGKR